MEPLLADGAELTLTADDCALEPQHGDLAVFHSGASSMPMVKRVVAVPGDTVALVDSANGAKQITVNGTRAVNSAGEAYSFNPQRAAVMQIYASQNNGVVLSDTYLVLGDQAHGTDDSSRFGYINRADVMMFVKRRDWSKQ